MSTRSSASRVVLATVAGVALLSIAQHPAHVNSGGEVFSWMMMALIVLAVAAAVTGLERLIFAERSRGRAAETFAATAFVLSGLILLGQWYQ